MGKRIISRRRGTGSPRYRSPGHRFVGKPMHPHSSGKGTVMDMIHAPGRKTPLAVADFGGEKELIIASEGMHTGEQIEVHELSKIPEGSKIYNVELRPGDGGVLCRSSGAAAVLISKDEGKAIILLPSRRKKELSLHCRAFVGSAAASGRIELPFRTAGKKFYAMRTVNRLWPRTSGVSMNPVDHPFGGKTKPGKHKTTSHHMPPGKKVGSISPARTGKK